MFAAASCKMAQGGGQDGRKRRHRRGLSRDEQILWDQVAGSVAPLKRETSAGHVSKPDPQPSRSRKPPSDQVAANQLRIEDQSTGRKALTGQVTRPRNVTPVAKTSTPPPHTGLDHKTKRRISRGRDGIDARIDLHGMRQSEAHSALRGFLFSAAAQGHRTVLVITGKGKSMQDREGGWSWAGDEQRGVLRRMLPAWLSEAGLHQIVVGFEEAHTRHGGAGAFYIRLRVRATWR